jgi:hypothetical protein
MKEKIFGYVIRTDGTHEPLTIEKDLKGYYDVLKCSTIDVVHASIGEETYDIIVDDEGLMKDKVIYTAINYQGTAALAGNIFIVKFDGFEDFTSINDLDIKNIKRHIISINTHKLPNLTSSILMFEYENNRW